MTPIENFRKQFFAGRKHVAFNNAGNTLLSLPAKNTIELWTQRFFEEGVEAIPAAYREANAARVVVADFLGAEALAFFPSTAAAISQVALGIDLKEGDEIIAWDQEYPSNHYPWLAAAKRSGAKVLTASSGPNLETPAESLIKLVTPRTKVIAFSWVQYRTGAVTDIKQLTDFAKSKGILTCADIIQGAGLFPFNFKESGLDAACGGSHKWMCSVPSAAYLCVNSRLLQDLSPITFGAMTYGTSEDVVNSNALPKATAHRFEPGSLSLLDILALGASARLLQDTGIESIARAAETLANRVVGGLTERGYLVHSPHGPKFRGAIVNFSSGPKSSRRSLVEIASALNTEGISYAQRAPGIRVSCHAYNTEADLDRFFSVL